MKFGLANVIFIQVVMSVTVNLKGFHYISYEILEADMQICLTFNTWVEEEIQKPVKEKAKERAEKCKKKKWWNPASWFCWLEWVFYWITIIITEIVLKIVATLVCQAIVGLTILAGTLLAMIYSIPYVGAFIKTLVEAVLSPIRRRIKLVWESALFWVRKKMDVIVLVMESDAILSGDVVATTPAEISDMMQITSTILERECKIKLRVLDTKFFGKDTPERLRRVHTDKSNGSQGNFEFFLGKDYKAAAKLILEEYMHLNPQTVTGIKAPAFVIFTTVNDADGIMHNVWSNNFVFVDDRPGPATIAHELSHLCGHIWHIANNKENLMTNSTHNHAGQFLNWFQRTLIRSSKYVSFI